MDVTESTRGESENRKPTEQIKKHVVAQNTGKCMEDSYPEGSIKLQLGSGKVPWENWLNVDIDGEPDVKCDLRKLPFEDNYADVECSIHVLEHFYAWEVSDVLTEWFRVLKPGGKLILELPSMDKVIHYLMQMVIQKMPVSHTFAWFALYGDPKYKRVEMCHKWGYTYLMLKELLESVGFVNVKAGKPRYHFPNRDMRLECFKPSSTT